MTRLTHPFVLMLATLAAPTLAVALDFTAGAATAAPRGVAGTKDGGMKGMKMD